ncbi:restriction endonuclease subunit S [Tenacibaculum finnmarkense genomovar finnmarkense]|uniref:restriction endonuclease subunit S n=1 Tax=Tenacibaculum finnmarkense TaxID=2781243 RepID=UPI001EFB0A53|nr:restriction endonuclease subunit S [Tenacibaculum finnmarkense]MCG8249589.1 restriction endonuclease subunit S [Tenacibaculum finnmarkense genomovar finnmarkense]
MESKLPKNWVDTEVGIISEIIRGITYNKLQAKSIKKNDDYLVLRGGNIQDGKITTKTNDVVYVESNLVKEIQKIKKGDVVIVGSTGSKRLIGKAGIAKEDFKEISFGAFLMLIRPSYLINKTLFDYYFISDNYRNVIRELAGGVNINNIRREYITNLNFPLPPLAEQQRIVAKLDTLFGSLDALKIRLNNIPQLIKNFKQAVLTQAVTGKLTQEWRVGKELEEWEETELINLILQKPRNGYSPPGVNYITEVKSLSLSATTSGKFNASKVKYLDIEKPKNDSHLWLKKGDILIQRSNSLDYVGTSAIYDGEDDDFIYPDIMMKIQVNEKIDNSYMNYVLSSSKIRTYYKDNATGTAGNMPKINQVVVSNTPICYPPKEEQTEIVKRVENLFSKADAIENQYKTLKEKIDRLPQAILAKAFKGELVAQLPTDGDAKDLLEEIKKLKESLVVKPKKKVVRNKK